MKAEREMTNLTEEELCDLMCGAPEEDPDDTIDPREILCDAGYEEVVLFDSPDFDTAIIGVADEGSNGRAVYDYEKMVAQLQKDEGWTREEAIEFIEYNTIRAMPYVEDPPIIITRLENMQ